VGFREGGGIKEQGLGDGQRDMEMEKNKKPPMVDYKMDWEEIKNGSRELDTERWRKTDQQRGTTGQRMWN